MENKASTYTGTTNCKHIYIFVIQRLYLLFYFIRSVSINYLRYPNDSKTIFFSTEYTTMLKKYLKICSQIITINDHRLSRKDM